MAKANTDPQAPLSVVELLAEIEAVGCDASSSSSWIDRLRDLLDHCLELVYQSNHSEELSATLKYGLDALRLWATHSASLVVQQPSSVVTCSAHRLLPEDRQLKLSHVIWSACNSERTQISSRSKAVMEAIIHLLHLVQHPLDSSKSALLPMPQDSRFLIDLISQSLSYLERKPSPIILQVLLTKYGSAPFHQPLPSATLYSDAQIYEKIVKGLGTVDGGANKRSRLALLYLKARASDLGCPLSSKAVETNPQLSSPEWTAWSSIWLGPLVKALETSDERLRSGLASYHLGPLFDMDTKVFGLLLNTLMSSESLQAEAIFLILRIGKVQNYCQLSHTSDFSTRVEQDGSVKVLVPAHLLKECILSAASELQMSALLLVIESNTPALPFGTAEFDILRTFFPYSLGISNPAARGQLRGFFVKMLTRLRVSSYALARDSAKILRIEPQERYAHESTKLDDLQAGLEGVKQLILWIYQLVQTTLHPGASYQACITALTFLDLILESGVDPRFGQDHFLTLDTASTSKTLAKNAGMSLAKSKQVFIQGFPFSLDLISLPLVQLLLSCSESTYDDIQARALTMLARFPAPLPGLQDQPTAVDRILGRAAQLMTSTRDFESTAASRLVQLYNTIYIRKLGYKPRSLLSLTAVEAPADTDSDGSHAVKPEADTNGNDSDVKPADTNSDKDHSHAEIQLILYHLDFLSYHLSIAESGRILEAATYHPLHGTFITLQELFASIKIINSLSQGDIALLGQAIARTIQLIDRTWNVTKPVLCNSAPEGSTGDEEVEQSAQDGSNGLEQPTHETARAMRIADELVNVEPIHHQPSDLESSESIAGPKHQIILSYSWRGIKEASALLGVLVATTLKPTLETAPGKQTSYLWSQESVQSVGARFNLWLTQVRHRGAFSTIYPAYCHAATAIVESGWCQVQSLPRSWIDTLIDAIQQPTTHISITRRSAGIGYAILALVGAHPIKTDHSVLTHTVKRLITIANTANHCDNEMPVSAIHSLNVLRVLVSDGQLSDYMSPFIGQLIELTISKFRSRFWALRNVSMMLFSSLCIRCFGSRNTNKETKDARMPVQEFFANYPNLDEFLYQTLQVHVKQQEDPKQSTANENDNVSSRETSLFAVLMLFSRMLATETPSTQPRYLERHRAFAQLIETCACSKVIKIREMAAKAYTAVVPLTTAADVCVELLNRPTYRSQNELHGRLLLVQKLMRSLSETEAPPATLTPSLEKLAACLVSSVNQMLVRNPCPVTQTAFLHAVQDFVSVLPKPNSDLGDRVLSVAEQWARALLDRANNEVKSLLYIPGGPGLVSVSTRVCLQACRNQAGRFVDCCIRLLGHQLEDVRLSLVEALMGNDGIATLLGCPHPQLQALCLELHHLVVNESLGFWIRVHAAETLHSLSVENLDLVAQLPVQLALETKTIARLVTSTSCVPLREALLPYLTDLAAAASAKANGSEACHQLLEEPCRILSLSADESQSVQSREAAAEAYRCLLRVLFSSPSQLATDSVSLFDARIAAIDLLTDDDPDIRSNFAVIVAKSLPSSISDNNNSSSSSVGLIRVARASGASAHVSTDRLWDWMSETYQKNTTATSNLWTNYLWRQLILSSLSELDQVFTTSTMLFAQEAYNQFRDPVATFRRAAKVLKQIPNDNNKPVQQIKQALQTFSQRLLNEPAIDMINGHRLATRLLLAYQATDDDDPITKQAVKVIQEKISNH